MTNAPQRITENLGPRRGHATHVDLLLSSPRPFRHTLLALTDFFYRSGVPTDTPSSTAPNCNEDVELQLAPATRLLQMGDDLLHYRYLGFKGRRGS